MHRPFLHKLNQANENGTRSRRRSLDLGRDGVTVLFSQTGKAKHDSDTVDRRVYYTAWRGTRVA